MWGCREVFVCPGCHASPLFVKCCLIQLPTKLDESTSVMGQQPTDSIQWQSALRRVKNGQLQATGNPALINKTSYSQKEEINSSSTNWEDRREEHSITVAWESLSYSELIFTERCPSLFCVQTAKKVGEWGDCSKRGSLSEVVNNHCN